MTRPIEFSRPTAAYQELCAHAGDARRGGDPEWWGLSPQITASPTYALRQPALAPWPRPVPRPDSPRTHGQKPAPDDRARLSQRHLQDIRGAVAYLDSRARWP